MFSIVCSPCRALDYLFWFLKKRLMNKTLFLSQMIIHRLEWQKRFCLMLTSSKFFWIIRWFLHCTALKVNNSKGHFQSYQLTNASGSTLWESGENVDARVLTRPELSIVRLVPAVVLELGFKTDQVLVGESKTVFFSSRFPILGIILTCRPDRRKNRWLSRSWVGILSIAVR